MAIHKIKFKMTATIVQEHIVEVDENEVPEDRDLIDYAQEKADETWDYTQPSNSENYTQSSEYMDEVE